MERRTVSHRTEPSNEIPAKKRRGEEGGAGGAWWALYSFSANFNTASARPRTPGSSASNLLTCPGNREGPPWRRAKGAVKQAAYLAVGVLSACGLHTVLVIYTSQCLYGESSKSGAVPEGARRARSGTAGSSSAAKIGPLMTACKSSSCWG